MNSEFMQYAAELALKGKGYTGTNPCVGAVIVRDGIKVGSGWHRRFGGAHAEIEALCEAGEAARGADLYVTLEPCTTYGKTPPCSSALIDAGIKRVFIGVLDPNPLHAGKALQVFAGAGVETVIGVELELCAGLIEDFAKYTATHIPYITMKIAQSLDGKIATSAGESRWITGGPARAYVHSLRRLSDAVLIGVNTALSDDPELTVRLVSTDRQPARVVLDSRCRISPASKLVQGAKDGTARTIVFTSRHAEADKAELLRDNGVEVIRADAPEEGINLQEVLSELGNMGMMNILVEGGSSVFASFLEDDFADMLHLFMAPIIIGGDKAKNSVGGRGVSHLRYAPKLESLHISRVADDILLSGKLHDYAAGVLELTETKKHG